MGTKRSRPPNALDDLERASDLSEQLVEAVRRHEEMLRQLTESPVMKAIERQEDALRRLTQDPMTEAMEKHSQMFRRITESPISEALQRHELALRQLTHNPIDKAMEKHAEMFRRITENPISEAMQRYEEALRQLTHNPIDEAMEKHAEMFRRITDNPISEAMQRHEDALRQLTHNPTDEAMEKHAEVFRRFTENPISEAMQRQEDALRGLTHSPITELNESLLHQAQKLTGATTQWHGMFERIANDFRTLVPPPAFDAMERFAESVRLSAPTTPLALNPTVFSTNWDDELAAAVERFRQQAQDIASDPEADLDDVEALVAQADAVSAAASPEARAVMNTYVKYLLIWLLGTLAEDPVKAAAHHALATLIIVLTSLQPVALPQPPKSPALVKSSLIEPAPEFRDGQARAVPGEWQNEDVPDVIKRAGLKATARAVEFFTVNIRNANTRRAYANATMRFFNWCDDRSLELTDITPSVVAAYIEEFQREASPPTVKQHLAAIRMLFDWLVTGQILPTNPASTIRGPKHVVKRGKAPVLSSEQARTLLDSIDTDTIDGLRDRALIGVMIYSFSRVSAAVRLKVADYYPAGKRWWFRFDEKGGKQHDVPAHHLAEAYVDAYLEVAGIASEGSQPLFRTLGRDRKLTDAAMTRTDALRMIKRRAHAAGLPSSICCHTFRATGITAYLLNGGTIEKAQQIAAHESIRTTKLYDRTSDQLTPDEIEKIAI
jgi:integrase/recombinase XerD